MPPLLILAQAAAAAAPAPAQPPVRAAKLVLVGDSTVQVGSGWGAAFCARHVAGALACLDLGRGGRSTSSYRAEGSWAIALAEARVPGYARTWVLIQFGHNDQPGKPGRSTDLASEFPSNLRRYVADVRAAGAVPILTTPLTRRMFRNGRLVRDLDPWAEAVRRVAAEERVALVDLNRASAALVEVIGPLAAAGLAQLPPPPAQAAAAATGTTAPSPPAPSSPTDPPFADAKRTFDYTHLGDEGAALFARLVAVELARAVPETRPMLVF